MIRVRFGLRLPWPLRNAGIVVREVQASVWETVEMRVEALRLALVRVGMGDIAARLVCERC